MRDLRSILVVVDRSDRDAVVTEKALALAQRFSARLELFLCDAEHEYSLRHSYDSAPAEASRAQCLADAGQYLNTLRLQLLRKVTAKEPPSLTCDAACESPLYDGILKKVAKSAPDLVMKCPSGDHPHRRVTLSDNDWQLARTCPAPLLLVNRRPWCEPLSLAAAVDVSGNETPGLARAIVHMAEYLQIGSKGSLDLISCLRSDASADERQEHARKLAALATEIRLSVEHVHGIDGDPEGALAPFAASRPYDVLMLGALTHRRGLAPLVGTLTSRLVDALDCDLLLVKPPRYTPSASA